MPEDKSEYTFENINACAHQFGVSLPTVSKYKAQFKKAGDTFTKKKKKGTQNNKARGSSTHSKTPVSTETYFYHINGVKITFEDQPKILKIGKKGIIVEY